MSSQYEICKNLVDLAENFYGMSFVDEFKEENDSKKFIKMFKNVEFNQSKLVAEKDSDLKEKEILSTLEFYENINSMNFVVKNLEDLITDFDFLRAQFIEQKCAHKICLSENGPYLMKSILEKLSDLNKTYNESTKSIKFNNNLDAYISLFVSMVAVMVENKEKLFDDLQEVF